MPTPSPSPEPPTIQEIMNPHAIHFTHPYMAMLAGVQHGYVPKTFTRTTKGKRSASQKSRGNRRKPTR